MDAPAPGVENLTAIVSGLPRVIFSTGKGNCIGIPWPRHQDSGQSHDREGHARQYRRRRVRRHQSGLTLDQATDIVQDKLVDVCWAP
ncbi:MAG: hypothetical protein ACLT2T_05880 [Bilophila wadsworthia]